LGNGILRIMKNCKDECPRLRSMDEKNSMNEKLDDYHSLRRKMIAHWNDLFV
jgi:hypothetical protein